MSQEEWERLIRETTNKRDQAAADMAKHQSLSADYQSKLAACDALVHSLQAQVGYCNNVLAWLNAQTPDPKPPKPK